MLLPSASFLICCTHQLLNHVLHACSEKEKQATDGLFEGENTGINFDAYEDIPVEVRTPIELGNVPIGKRTSRG